MVLYHYLYLLKLGQVPLFLNSVEVPDPWFCPASATGRGSVTRASFGGSLDTVNL